MLLSMIVVIIAIYMVIIDSDIVSIIVHNRHVVVSYLIGIRCVQIMLYGEHLRYMCIVFLYWYLRLHNSPPDRTGSSSTLHVHNA